ncbi:MAG: PAS domain S-box protein [Chitinophagaceae bacterium]
MRQTTATNNVLTTVFPFVPGRISTLAALIENSPDAILARGPDKKIISWNRGAEKLLGFPKEEAIGSTALELGMIRFTAAEISEMDAALATTGTWTGEKEYFSKNGSRLFGAVTANMIASEEGDTECVLFIIKDFTRQKQLEEELKMINHQLEEWIKVKTKKIADSEKRFRAMTENNHDVVVLIDGSQKLIYRSPAAFRITGWTDEEALQPGFLQKVIHPEDQEKMEAVMKESLADPGRIINVSYRIKHKKGNIRFFEGTLVNLLQAEAGVMILDTRDVTERVQEAAELEKHRKQLAEREEQLNLYIEHSPAAIAIFDNHMHYLAVSNRWISDYGLEGKNIIGESHYTVFPEVPVEWKAVHKRCLEGAVEKNEEDPFLRADGTITWLRWEVRPWHHASGAIGGVIMFTENITQRKMAEVAVKKSEANFRTLVERISDGFIALDKDWNLTYVNHMVEKMIGRSAEGLTGKNIWEEFPEEVDKVFYHAFHEAMEEQKQIHLEDYSIAAGIWVQVNIYPSATGLSVFFRDISREKEAQYNAKKSEEVRELIMASALDAIIFVDSRSAVTHWNKQAEKLFGWKEEEVSGRSISETIIPPRYRQYHNAGFKKFLETGEGPILNKLIEIAAVNKEGTEFPVELFIVPVKGKDQFSFCAFIRDISIRKKAELEVLRNRNRLQQAQQIAKLGNWEIDFVNKTSTWSDEAYRIYGLEPDDHNISMEEWMAYVHPDDRENVEQAILEGKKDWKGASFYHRIVRKDGTVRHLYAESRFDMDEQGHPASMYGIAHDITEMKKLEQELQEQQHKEHLRITAAVLEAQEKERNTIGIELHDNVNQILVGTKMVLSMLKPDSSQANDIVSTSINNIQLAINENRKIAHELVSPDFDGKSLAGEIEKIADAMLRKANMQVTLDTSLLDETLLPNKLKLSLYRITQEQCTNIVKYSKAGAVTISLSSKGDSLQMVIADDGVGAVSKKQSSGIGLRNVKSRLSVFDGTAEIKTAPGKGFALHIHVPLS